MIAHIVIPRRNEDSIVGLKDKVVGDVVNDDRSVDVTAQQTQIFHQEGSVLAGVLPVQSVLDVVADVDLVDHLVCVLLQGRREDHYLVVLCHRFYELDAARSHEEETIVLVLDIVN